MADRTLMATKRVLATSRITRAVDAIQAKRKPEGRLFVGSRSRDDDVKQTELLESVATFLEREAGIDEPVPEKFQPTDSVAEPESGVVEQAPADEGGDELFAGQPLDAFDDLSDDDIRELVPDITDETLAEIRKAQADRDGDDSTEPLFHGKPLSFYAEMTDDQILDIDGIGPATLDKIRAAQESAK